MTIDDVQSRFVNEIALRGYDDKYIDRDEEREILQIAIQLGFGLEQGREAMAKVCDREGYILENMLVKTIKSELEKLSVISRDDFERLVQNAYALAQSRKNYREIQRIIVTVMEDNALNRVKTGLFTNWYKSLQRELGLA